MSAHHVCADFLDNPFLGSCKLVGKRIVAKIEVFSHQRHLYAVLSPAADELLLQQGKLEQEQFFKFKPVAGAAQGLCVGGEVYVAQCQGKAHQAVFLKDIVRKSLFSLREHHAQSIGHQLVHHLSGDAGVLELFR